MTNQNDPSERRHALERVALRDVAVACYLFNTFTSYNRSLETLRVATDGQIDLSLSSHRMAVLEWLNDWGCRHLAKDQHEVASESIREWYEEEASLLQPASQQLWTVEDVQLAQAASVYASLKNRMGAHVTRQKEQYDAPIGPTAASKVLFALRPQALAPWDAAMRLKLADGDGANDYQQFLELVRTQACSLVEQCRRNGFDITQLPRKLGRDSSTTVVALLNEHMWMTVSSKRRLPSQETLARWASW